MVALFIIIQLKRRLYILANRISNPSFQINDFKSAAAAAAQVEVEIAITKCVDDNSC